MRGSQSERVRGRKKINEARLTCHPRTFIEQQVEQTMAITIMRRIKFCAGHRLAQHGGKCEYFHGHNYTAEFYVTGNEVDESTCERTPGFCDIGVKTYQSLFVECIPLNGLRFRLGRRRPPQHHFRRGLDVELNSINPASDPKCLMRITRR